MAGPMPAEVSVELFNRLVHAKPEQRTEIEQILWRLKTLLRQQPSNHRLRVAILRAHMLLGQAAEAQEVADTLWTLRRTLGPEPASTFAIQLLQLGMNERFLEYGRADALPDAPASVANMRSRASWGAGDLDAVRENIAIIERLTGAVIPAWARFFQRIEDEGAAPHFRPHQQLVQSHLAGWQLATSVALLEDPEDPGDWDSPTVFVYGPGNYRDRRRLSDAIGDALVAYYRDQGLNHTDFASRLVPVLLSYEAAFVNEDWAVAA